MSRRKLELSGSGVAALRECLQALCLANRWPPLEPLPVTRFLGESFGISNVSAFRVLNELSVSGHLWRAPNGRYFLASARRLLEKPAPVACLIRRLERWTEVSRSIMHGVDEACGDSERAMLMVHDRVLFRQADPTALTAVGSDNELRQSMEDFLRIHSERISGVILDELWPDRVLTHFKKQLRSGVVVYRRTALPFLGCVCADVGGAARLVVDHAVRNRFDKFAILLPWGGYQPSEEMALALQRAAKARFGKVPQIPWDFSRAASQNLISTLRRQRRRMLLVATEDNTALAVLDALGQADLAVPEQMGLVTTMGSRIALDRSLTAVGFDFRLMGAEAARMAVAGTMQHLKLPAAFFPGNTA